MSQSTQNLYAKPSNNHVTNYQRNVKNVCISTINTKVHILTNYNIIKKEKNNKKNMSQAANLCHKSPPRH